MLRQNRAEQILGPGGVELGVAMFGLTMLAGELPDLLVVPHRTAQTTGSGSCSSSAASGCGCGMSRAPAGTCSAGSCGGGSSCGGGAGALDSPLVSEHLAFVRVGDLEAGHLLPVPRTREALDVVAENIRIAQGALPVPLALDWAARNWQLTCPNRQLVCPDWRHARDRAPAPASRRFQHVSSQFGGPARPHLGGTLSRPLTRAANP